MAMSPIDILKLRSYLPITTQRYNYFLTNFKHCYVLQIMKNVLLALSLLLSYSLSSQVHISYSIDPSIALGYGVTNRPELNNKMDIGYKHKFLQYSLNYEGNYGVNLYTIKVICKVITPEVGCLSYSVGFGYGKLYRDFGTYDSYKFSTELRIRLSKNIIVITGWDADGRPELCKQNKHLRLNGTKAQFVGSVWGGVMINTNLF